MAGNRISKSKLNNELKKLPLPVQEHCRRTKLIANFILEKIKLEDWFFDSKLNAEHIAYAVFLHDIGKTQIPKEHLYAEHNVSKSKQSVYRTHIDEGVRLIETLCDISFENFDERKLETYIYRAITEHHECADGCGFPKGLNSSKMSVTGKITAIADTVDNLFFVGKAEELDFDELLGKLESMAGNDLDSELLGVMLSDKEAFLGFIKYIYNRYKNKRKVDNYGLQLRFKPIRNIIDNVNREYICDLVINDPYYGIVGPEVFVPVAVSSSQIMRLTLLALERLCLAIDRVVERGGALVPISINIDPMCFNSKRFVADALKLLDKYSIKRNSICLVVDELGIEELEEDVDYKASMSLLHEGGYRTAVIALGEGSKILGELDSLPIDYLYVHSKYTHKLAINSNTYGVASGLLDIAHNLHISVVFLGCDTHDIEKSLLKLKARYASGELYDAPLREQEMVSRLVSSGGDA